MRSSISRRAAVAGAAALVVAGRMASAEDTGPVRIGLIYSKQGPGAAIGEFLQRGSELAVEQAGRKVLGRPIEITWLDEPNPQVSQQEHAAAHR